MEQLSGNDSLFLFQERGNNFNHISALGIYDPSSAPGGKVRFKQILAHFERRLGTSPVFRRRLLRAPMDIDRPYWMEDPSVDTEFHVRHIALPAPGDWRQLMIQVARLHSRPLDFSKPLWEIYVIEGLDHIPNLPTGSFAIFMKFHHASLDGQAAAAVIGAVHSISADADLPLTTQEVIYADRDPSQMELYAKVIGNTARRMINLAKLSAETAGIAANLGMQGIKRKLGGDAAPQEALFKPVPTTRFDADISPHRVVEVVALPFADMKRIRDRIAGATINDIFLAVSGGALRAYLKSKNELPVASLRALMPISLRPDSTGKTGNDVTGLSVALRSDLADPVERLFAVHNDVRATKEQADAMGADLLPRMLGHLPNFAADQIMRLALVKQINAAVSNVKGPSRPLFVAGARAVSLYPVSVITDGVGVNLTGFSYNETLWISLVSCRAIMPDPGFFADCVRQEFADLIAAAGAYQAEPAVKAAPKPKARAVPKPKAAAKPAPRARKNA
ncbi:MAG: wax ester/triacylglycerol synthase family O-acyltransferase [Pseudomonadota bacterium]